MDEEVVKTLKKSKLFQGLSEGDIETVLRAVAVTERK